MLKGIQKKNCNLTRHLHFQEHEGDGICEEHTGGVRPLFLLLVLHANALLLLSLLPLPEVSAPGWLSPAGTFFIPAAHRVFGYGSWIQSSWK